jgi:hypothetical protein
MSDMVTHRVVTLAYIISASICPYAVYHLSSILLYIIPYPIVLHIS